MGSSGGTGVARPSKSRVAQTVSPPWMLGPPK